MPDRQNQQKSPAVDHSLSVPNNSDENEDDDDSGSSLDSQQQHLAAEANPASLVFANIDDASATGPAAEGTDQSAGRKSKQFPPKQLARISKARKLRKTRLSLGNFIMQPGAVSGAADEIGSGNSSESASSYGSVPSDFDDVCNNS